MHMREFQQRLNESGFGMVPPAVIRSAEQGMNIPLCARDWRGFRLFTEEHVEAMVRVLSHRRQRFGFVLASRVEEVPA